MTREMLPVSYAEHGSSTSPRWSSAFAKGCGGKWQFGGPLCDGPVAFWGSIKWWHLLEQAQSEGLTWYYGDHGYFGRGVYFRCTKNKMQHDGLGGDDDSKRFRGFHIPVNEWRKSGGPILLCPQTDPFFCLHGTTAAEWIVQTTAELRKHTDREIILRWKTDDKKIPFRAAIKGAWAVVTFVSNAAVDAILAGVPAICTKPCAALSMSTGDLSLIENLPMPDGRESWAARLANNQWTLAEMQDGKLWNKIGEQ